MILDIITITKKVEP